MSTAGCVRAMLSLARMDVSRMAIVDLRKALAKKRVDPELVAACRADGRSGVRDLLDLRDARQERRARETRRLRKLYLREVEVGREHGVPVAGVDEVGRGPLAGPVVAACVVLPARPRLDGLDDSKQLSALQRARLEEKIRKVALGVGVGILEPADIDRHNIYQASLLAMRRAVETCAPLSPGYLLLDAVRLKELPLPQEGIVGGDALCACIAAASIVAKELRDRMMRDLDQLYPGYDFTVHKGYGTAGHLTVLQRLGPSPAHRQSFAPVRNWREAAAAEVWDDADAD